MNRTTGNDGSEQDSSCRASSESVKPKVMFLIGCTGCGKSAVGFELAKQISGEIVAADSMKIYRQMDIGTAKPSPKQRAEVAYHLIDVVAPWEEFSVAKYVAMADEAIRDIDRRSRRIIVIGGTALYIKGLAYGLFEGPEGDAQFRERLRERAAAEGILALHEELRQVDPEAAERIHANDYRRIERALEVYAATGSPITELQTQWAAQALRYDCQFVGLRRDKEDQNHRTNMRVRRMMQAGLLEEVKQLMCGGRDLVNIVSAPASQAVGYAELLKHLRGEVTLEKAVERIKINSRRLAKSQRTWFRRFADVEWFDLTGDEPTESIVDRIRRRMGAEMV